MKSTLLVIAALFAGVVSPSASAPIANSTTRGDSIALSWNGKNYKTDKLPEGIPKGTLEALEYFSPWAKEMSYVAQLSESGSFVMFTHKKKFSSRDWSKAIAPALELINEFAPLPDRGSSGAETGQSEPETNGEFSVTWGEVHDLEHYAANFFDVKNSEHMASLLEYIGKREEKPADWAKSYSNLPGLILHRPLAGIIVGTAPGVEEWDPLNESINRIARMMLVRRFRTIPYWMSVGIAWNVEFDVRGNIFCFPHRDRFVGVAEHGGWRDDLKVQFKKKSGPKLDVGQLANWRIGTYDPIQAARAWGTVSYINKAKPGALGQIIEDLRLITDEKGRMTRADGTWERIPNFSPSAEDQLEVMERHLGKSFLEDVTSYFNKGMKKPAKR